jgi:MoaA/NifB/PqqE/SkfB family radical SAM enzyme
MDNILLTNITDLITQYSNFEIKYNNNIHSLEFGDSYSNSQREYLEKYIQGINKYKNITSNREYATYSIYQPPLATEIGKRNLALRMIRRFEGLRIPAVATVGLTKKCQCKCMHCSADYHMSSDSDDLSKEIMISAINEIIDLGTTNIMFVGGEPLLRKDILEIITGLDKSRAIITMFTNGEFMTQSKAEELKDAGLFGVFFSLDSNQKEVHNLQRKRKELFEKAEIGIKNALAARLVVGISTYLSDENLSNGQLENMMELGKKWNVHEVTFFDAIPVGRYNNNSVSTYLSLQNRILIKDVTRRYRKLPFYPALSPQSNLTSEIGSAFCFAANTQLYLSSSGEITPCDFTPLTFGKYPEKSILELWHKMIESPFYKNRSKTCRMQDAEFRRITIDKIPTGAKLPYPIELLEKK